MLARIGSAGMASGTRASPAPGAPSAVAGDGGDADHMPALGAAIVDASGLVGIGAAGVRRIDDPTRATASDLWHLGSCTKSMTATWVATRVEAGEIAWSTTLAEVYPDLVKAHIVGIRSAPSCEQDLIKQRFLAVRCEDANFAALFFHLNNVGAKVQLHAVADHLLRNKPARLVVKAAQYLRTAVIL